MKRAARGGPSKTQSSSPRRTQAERRAASRIRLIEATIRALNKYGYGGTSVSVVVDEARASRGALLNVFPTKVDLMLAVVRHVWELDQRYYRQWGASIPSSQERLRRMVEPAWKALSRSTGIAVLEILVACRSDPELAAVVIPAQLQVQRDARAQLVAAFHGQPGLEPEALINFSRFLEATLRGLAVDLMVTRDTSSVEPTQAYIRETAERLLAASK